MPKVGDKEFSYTPEGVKAAKKESLQSGMPMNDASMRNQQTFAGSGNANFNSIGAAPKINLGGNIMDGSGYNPSDRLRLDQDVMDASDAYYEKGGKVKDKRVFPEVLMSLKEREKQPVAFKGKPIARKMKVKSPPKKKFSKAMPKRKR